MSANPNDQIRDALLRYFYDIHAKAKSPKTAAVGIRDVHAAMKVLGFKQAQIGGNLDYLIQKGWVREVRLSRSFTTKTGTTQNSEQVKYKLSDTGRDRLESASMFKLSSAAAHVNITNIRGVTVVGDGNVVNTIFRDATEILTDLRQQIAAAPAIAEEERLSVIADIDGLQSQLQKPEPTQSVVAALWRNIERVATAGGFADTCMKLGIALAPLIQ